MDLSATWLKWVPSKVEPKTRHPELTKKTMDRDRQQRWRKNSAKKYLMGSHWTEMAKIKQGSWNMADSVTTEDNRPLKVEIHRSSVSSLKVHHWGTILRFLTTIWLLQWPSRLFNRGVVAIVTKDPIEDPIDTINQDYKKSLLLFSCFLFFTAQI